MSETKQTTRVTITAEGAPASGKSALLGILEKIATDCGASAVDSGGSEPGLEHQLVVTSPEDALTRLQSLRRVMAAWPLTMRNIMAAWPPKKGATSPKTRQEMHDALDQPGEATVFMARVEPPSSTRLIAADTMVDPFTWDTARIALLAISDAALISGTDCGCAGCTKAHDRIHAAAEILRGKLALAGAEDLMARH